VEDIMIDYLIMLLSTDWFGLYWSSIGVDVGEDVKTPLRLGCRDIVHQILSGEEHYYLVSFSDQRKTETRATLESLMRNCGAPEGVQKVVKRWAALTDHEQKAAWICNDFTTDILSGNSRNGDPKLDARIVAELAASRKHYDMETSEFSQISLASPSTWDAYIRALTPEQPTALADNLASVLEYQGLEELWNSVKGRLTAAQKSELVTWYHEMAKARGRRDIIPAYLAEHRR
jgi:hypothetical protein